MRAFARLLVRLERTTRTGEKVDALESYFRTAPPEDAVWALHFLIGRNPRRAVNGTQLRSWVADAAQLPSWLVDASYAAVGDLAETAALLAPGSAQGTDMPLSVLVRTRLLPLSAMDDAERRTLLLDTWHELDDAQRFVFNKLITGSFRVGVGRALVVRALAAVTGGEPAVLAHRIAGRWEPTAATWARLVDGGGAADDAARPYPFLLAHALQDAPHALGDIGDWQAEWKWDGIRAQLIRRRDATVLWSRGEELITDAFPELAAAARLLPEGTVLDGEVVVWADDRPQPFAVLQTRLGRKRVTPKLLDDAPARLLIYDVLEIDGEDVRARPLRERRAWLETELAPRLRALPAQLSPLASAETWDALADLREAARERGAEGLMLKRLDSPYGAGRPTGSWWKWKVDPLTVDAVLMYAQGGSGRRASLFTDYTFGVWDGDELVPFAKAYSGLTDAEIRRVDRFVQRNTVERFGPVRSVQPDLVFEIAFEGIRASSRHRSGVAVRFPRIARWRTDKGAADADTLDRVRALLGVESR